MQNIITDHQYLDVVVIADMVPQVIENQLATLCLKPLDGFERMGATISHTSHPFLLSKNFLLGPLPTSKYFE
jgi:hypothetical protein